MPPIVFFHAPDDSAARATGTRPPLPFDGELSEVLRELETFLTDRSYHDVNCDDRHLAVVTEVGIHTGGRVATLTDTLRDALAAADDETLRAAAFHWPVTGDVTPVARAAAAIGDRLYVHWTW